ncbi:MAG TPA: hypothetical protein VGI67_04840 [Thermoleophilaceae bacterium]
MRIRGSLGALCVGGLAFLCAASIAGGAPGDLDPGFNGSGKLVIDFGGDDMALAVATQPDGKILLAGTGPPNNTFTITRLNPNGSPDAAFGNPGTGTSRITIGPLATARALALQPDGKILVAGSVQQTQTNADAAVARLNPDGTPDTTFGPSGWRGVDLGGPNDFATGIVPLPDGKVIVVGVGTFGTGFVVARLTSRGLFDGTFTANRGLTTIPGTAGGEAFAVALAPDGKLVVAGTVIPQGRTASNFVDIGVARIKSDGSPDTSFDGDGARTIDSGVNEEVFGAALQPDGKVLLAGDTDNKSFTLLRLNVDGSSDNDFAGSGRAEIAFPAGSQGANALALQPDGKIVLAGRATNGMAFARVQPGGALDITFSGDGRQVVLFNSNPADRANGVALEPSGAIVGGGVAASADKNVGVVRLQGDAGSQGGPGGGGGTGGGPVVNPKCAGRSATIVGTNGRDKLKGTRRNDVIVGAGGSDRIDGGGGNDVICGGGGNDRLSGGGGKDKIYGQAGKDSLSGGDGTDTLSGGYGNDKLSGGAGKDKLSGAAGKDKLNGGTGKDRLLGGPGKDSCSGHDSESSC